MTAAREAAELALIAATERVSAAAAELVAAELALATAIEALAGTDSGVLHVETVGRTWRHAGWGR